MAKLVDENSAEEWNRRGVMLVKKNKHKDAIVYFEQALKLDPYFADAWYNKGAALLEQDKLKDALTCLDKVLILDSEHAEAWFGKGRAIYLQKGMVDEAIACLQKANDVYEEQNDKDGLNRLAEWLVATDKTRRTMFRRHLLR